MITKTPDELDSFSGELVGLNHKTEQDTTSSANAEKAFAKIGFHLGDRLKDRTGSVFILGDFSTNEQGEFIAACWPESAMQKPSSNRFTTFLSLSSFPNNFTKIE